MEIEIIQPKTAEEFERYYQLRWQVLRKPWNQAIGSEKDELESSSFHFMAVFNNAVIAVCRIQTIDKNTAQIRFMAVADGFQGKGIGKTIISAIENFAKNNLKAESIILQARENAVVFYKSQGYVIVEKTFLLYNEIQHFLMAKNLS